MRRMWSKYVFASNIQWIANFMSLLCVKELEKALSEQDLNFLGDLIACLLQGCYQRTDIT